MNWKLERLMPRALRSNGYGKISVVAKKEPQTTEEQRRLLEAAREIGVAKEGT